MTDILDVKEEKILARLDMPKGWEIKNKGAEKYMNFCYPLKQFIEFESDKADVLYLSGEGFSFVGGADVKMPHTQFIDYRPFEYVYEYIQNYIEKLAGLIDTEYETLGRKDVAFDKEKGEEKVRQHAIREIKRQGGNNQIAIIKLYYEAGCIVFKIKEKIVALNTHIEAVKAGMDARGLKSKLAGKVSFGDDNDLKVLNPMQTMDWESNGMFILVTDEENFESAYCDFEKIASSFEEGEGFKEQAEAGKKEIQGKLFMSSKASKKMQVKKYNEWQKLNSSEKRREDEYIKNWLLERI